MFSQINYNEGFCIWITGLPCSGKSTVANKLREFFDFIGRKTTLIDGDELRHFLGNFDFSSQERHRINLLAGYIASQVVWHGGIAICAMIAPFESVRQKIRNMFEDNRFVLVHLSTPINVCISRDVKGMYRKALKGEIENFTGISSPYEEPLYAELKIDTSAFSVTETVGEIVSYLLDNKLLCEKEVFHEYRKLR